VDSEWSHRIPNDTALLIATSSAFTPDGLSTVSVPHLRANCAKPVESTQVVEFFSALFLAFGLL
jgi:hypothetical protein